MRRIELSITADGDLVASYAGESVTFDRFDVIRRLHDRRGPKNLTLAECLAMRRDRKRGQSVPELAGKYSVSRRTVFRITSPNWKSG